MKTSMMHAFSYSEFDHEISRFGYGEDQVQGIHGNCFVDLEHDNLDYYVEGGGLPNLVTFKKLIRTFHMHPSDWQSDNVLTASVEGKIAWQLDTTAWLAGLILRSGMDAVGVLSVAGVAG